MNLDKLLSELDTYICDKTKELDSKPIELVEISKLKTVMRRLQQIPLLANLKDNTAETKLRLKHKESTLVHFEHIGDIIAEIESKLLEFKGRYLAYGDITSDAYNNFATINTNIIIESLLNLFLPLNEVYMISRSSSYKTWGFDDTKTDVFVPNNFFEILQNFHADQNADFSLAVWDDNMRESVKDYVNFDSSAQYYCSIFFMYPQTLKMTEASVCLIFAVDMNKLSYMQGFFSDPTFEKFNTQLFLTLYELCARVRSNELEKGEFKSISNKIKRLLSIFSVELFIRRTDELDELEHTIITSKPTGSLELEYKLIKLEDLSVSLILDNDDTRLDDSKLEDLRCNVRFLLNKFVEFFECNLKAFVDVGIEDKTDYVLILNREQQVLSLEAESNAFEDFIDIKKKFLYGQPLDYYIKDQRLLEELRKYTSIELQRAKQLERIQFNFENMQVNVYPLFVLNHLEKENEMFMIKVTKNTLLDFINSESDKKNTSKKSINELIKNVNDDDKNEILDSDDKSIDQDKDQTLNIIENEDLKAAKKVRFLQKQLSSIEEYAQDVLVKQEETSNHKQDSSNNSSVTALKRNSNFNKLFLEKSNLETMFAFFKQKIEEKIKLLKSLEEVENSINETMSMFPVETLKDTIAGEYMQNDNFKEYFQKHKVRNSIITNYFSSSGGTDSQPLPKPNPILKKESIMKNSFELIDDDKLHNYQINFLEKNSLYIYNSIFTMLYTSGIIAQYNMDPMVLYSFLSETERLYNYSQNRYHNFTHAIMVMNACYYFLKKTPADELFEDIGIAALLFAALMHDIDHKGNNNDYEVKAYTDLALIYNDKSVLENHHAATAFKLLKRVELNIFEGLNTEDFNMFRRIVIELILMTDPKHHFGHLGKLKKRISKSASKEEFKQSKSMDNFILFAGNLVHCADIYGPVRPAKEAAQWSSLIEQEFLNQLAKEQTNDLPVTKFFQDLHLPRNKIMNEIFFVDNIVKPLWVCIDDFLDNKLKNQIQNIETNSKAWKEKLEQLDEAQDKTAE